MNDKKILSYALIGLGILLILVGVALAYSEYKSANNLNIPTEIASSLGTALSVFTVIAIKTIFIAIIMWGGGIILSNGIKMMKQNEQKQEKSPEGDMK